MVNNNLKGATCSKISLFFGISLLLLPVFPSFAQQKAAKVPAVDTFKLADKFIARNKYRKAEKLYKAYQRNHPKDVNAPWKLGQVRLWQSRNKQSDAAYTQALKLDPKNDNLHLNYIHSLLDMGKFSRAETLLGQMELEGKDYPNMALLRARMNYYKGDYRQAAAYMRKNLNEEPGNGESEDLNDQIEFARSPLVSLQAAYLSDNQPLAAVISTLKAEAFLSKYSTLYLTADEYHFTENKIADAPWIRIGDKLFFSQIGLHLNIGGGIVQYPVKNEIGWSGNLSLNQRISAHFDADLSVDHVPYLDTKTSIDTNISATRVAAMLNWHMAGWSAQAAFMNSTYETNNNVYGAYAWGLAPLVKFKTGKLSVGYSISYSNSNESSYKPVLGVSQIVANYATNPNIEGLYNPYFTPKDLFINSALLTFNVNLSKAVNFTLSGDVGYGSISNPFLYLDKDNAGNNVIKRGFSTEYFVPVNASAAFNFNLGKTWVLSAKYIYHNTYFFTSNYGSIGIQKSFQHRKKKWNDDGKASTFLRLIKEIENDIQGLYKCKSQTELVSSVGKVRGKLVSIRNAQKSKEVLPNSDEAGAIQERYDAVEDMISELDAVDLNDYTEGSKKDKKLWLTEKQYELTSITYGGAR